MTEYTLIAQRFDQVLERDSKGNVTKRVRHRFGSTVSGLSEAEAVRLLKAGAIAVLDESDDDEPAEPSDPPQAPADEAPKAPTAPASSTPKEPAQVAPKSEWIAYAKAFGIPEEQAEDKTKAQIAAAVNALKAKA